MRFISLSNQLEIGCRNKCKVVSDLAKNNFGINISAQTVKRWINRWIKTNKLAIVRQIITQAIDFK
jgi:hypothetical protein